MLQDSFFGGFSMMKKILVGLGILIVLIGVGVYFLGANIDSIVKAAVEKYGTEATQTDIALDNVSIAVASGEASLSGLSVGNPDGFEADQALYLGKISIKIDAKSLTGSGPIVIESIFIEKPQIAYEIDNEGKSNLQTLANNAQKYATSLGGGKKAKAEKVEPAAPAGEGRKLIIKSLTIRDGEISISQALLQGKKLSAALPLIHLENIGKGKDGATPAEVTEKILGVLSESASQVASTNLTKALSSSLENAGTEALKDKADELGDKAGEIGNQVKGLFGE